MVHIWDSETLLKLQEIGLGAFERGVGALAFSAVVSCAQSFQIPIYLFFEASRVSRTLGWPLTQYVDEGVFELLILLPLASTRQVS